jgi:hypothetical protein
LKLPNCTSWHSNQGTACNISEPLSSNDLGQFHPDTKSKCVCDDTFTVPVTVEDAEIEVTKTANPTQLPEPGGTVTFTVNVKNLAEHVTVTIDSIVDVPFGDIAASGDYEPNDCDDLIGVVLDPGEEQDCTFTVGLEGDAGDRHTDTVTVTGTQSGNGNEVDDSDDADVDFTDVFEDPTVSKTAKSTANCTVEATYEVVLSNNSTIDTLSTYSLDDDSFGDVTSVHVEGGGFEITSTTCDSNANPYAPIGPLGNYTCQFVGKITDTDCDVDHTNTVTASVTDEDGHTSSPSDDAVVTLSTTP